MHRCTFYLSSKTFKDQAWTSTENSLKERQQRFRFLYSDGQKPALTTSGHGIQTQSALNIQPAFNQAQSGHNEITKTHLHMSIARQ